MNVQSSQFLENQSTVFDISGSKPPTRDSAAGGSEVEADHDILRRLLSRTSAGLRADLLAGSLMYRFGSFGAVLTAPRERLINDGGLTCEEVSDLKLVETATGRLAQTRVLGREIISSWDALVDYCRIRMAHSAVEQFRVLFLDRKNRLIIDELLQRGTIDHVPVYPREVAKRALELDASALILVHNHPSGDPKPSQSDIDMTNKISAALEVLEIQLHDHMIISREADFSFRSNGLL